MSGSAISLSNAMTPSSPWCTSVMLRILPCADYGGHMESPDLARMRSEYARDGLDEAAAGDDPLGAVRAVARRGRRRRRARAERDGAGHRDARRTRRRRGIVLLKGFDAAGPGVLHGLRVAQGPRAGRRTRGPRRRCCGTRCSGRCGSRDAVTRLSTRRSPTPTSPRGPRGSQIGAVASPQSQVDRRPRGARAAGGRGRGAVRRPRRRAPRRAGAATASRSRSIEFWQGRENRLHDRLRYTRTSGDVWTRERLAP